MDSQSNQKDIDMKNDKARHNIELANQYRKHKNFDGGVITIYKGEVQGWSNELRNPERWAPGCIAVNEDGDQWVTIGGTKYNGAERWEVLNLEKHKL